MGSSTCSRVVLGATIALGGCSLAGCDDHAGEEIELSALARVEPTEADLGVFDDSEPDLEAEAGRLGDVVTAPGFTPDPLITSGVTSGGHVDLNDYDDRCTGFAAGPPDLLLRATYPFAELAITASPIMEPPAPSVSLMIIGADGDSRCSSAEEPTIRGTFERGVHRVWIGAPNPDSPAPFMLTLSELEATSPPLR